jgi:hypothetical protein
MDSGPMTAQKWAELQMWLEVLTAEELAELIRRANAVCNAKAHERIWFVES